MCWSCPWKEKSDILGNSSLPLTEIRYISVSSLLCLLTTPKCLLFMMFHAHRHCGLKSHVFTVGLTMHFWSLWKVNTYINIWRLAISSCLMYRSCMKYSGVQNPLRTSSRFETTPHFNANETGTGKAPPISLHSPSTHCSSASIHSEHFHENKVSLEARIVMTWTSWVDMY